MSDERKPAVGSAVLGILVILLWGVPFTLLYRTVARIGFFTGWHAWFVPVLGVLLGTYGLILAVRSVRGLSDQGDERTAANLLIVIGLVHLHIFLFQRLATAWAYGEVALSLVVGIAWKLYLRRTSGSGGLRPAAASRG